ncbi:MAG: hypothetical protein K2L35_04540 [Muribaculaceae bacterium]|nr:hypothetical protein [Muribaculaceae bacterium]
MKKFLMTLVIAMTMSFVGFSVSAASPKNSSSDFVGNVWKSLPETLVVKQEATLGNGQVITIYYKKSGDQCEVYTPDNVSGLTVNALSDLKESDFSIAMSAKGRKVFTAPFSKVRRLVKQAVNTYL